MTTVEREANPAADSPDRPIGFGRMQRKEDPRFVRVAVEKDTVAPLIEAGGATFPETR